MSLRRGVADGHFVSMGEEAPRMRSSRISSHYQGTTVSNSRRSSNPLSRKPLLDRNPPLVKGRVAGSFTAKPLSSRTSSTRTASGAGQQIQRPTATSSTNKKKQVLSSYDKENQTNTRASPKKDRGEKKKSTGALRAHKPTSVATPSTRKTEMQAPSTRKVTFTPATKEENRGSNLNSLRRSIRNSITPPSQKTKLARTPTSNSTAILASSRSLPLALPNNKVFASGPPTTPLAAKLQSNFHNSPDMLTLRTTPCASDNVPQLPKTPKSILKDQLDMSMDESMLLSPGCLNNTSLLQFQSHTNPTSSNRSISASTSIGIEEDDELLFESPPAVTKAPVSRAPEEANDKEEREEVRPANTNSKAPLDNHKQSEEHSSVVEKGMKGSIFSGSKRNARRNMQSTSQSVVTATAPTVVSTKNDAMEAPEKKTILEKKGQLCETPHIQNTNQAIAQQQAPVATPFCQRGNGVCMDLTSIFFNEPKTIRRTNKSETLKASREIPKVLQENDVSGEKANSAPGRLVVPTDDEWAEMQCETFSKWLNFTLQPTEDIDHQQESMDANDSESEDRPVSPKGSVALRTLILHQRMAKARGAGSGLFVSAEMKKIQDAIDTEVAKGKLSLRADRDMYADLTQRKKIVSLLLSYSTPWLRLGLESLFSENILPEVPSQFSPMKRGNTNSRNTPAYQLRLALRDFIVNRVLSDASVLAKYTKGKCKVPSGNFEKRYRTEIRALVLRRLLTLIFFLDRAKTADLLERSPRLFTKSAPVKSSREVLISFCRDFLASEGDITKHLGRVGLKVAYKQDPIDEIELSVTNFAIDLRDGIRLTKLSEILTGARPKSLLIMLRVPAMSRLQKIHNVGLALGALRESGVAISDDIAPHQIVDGNRSMVLKLMWIVIAHYCFPAVLDFEKVEEEIVDLRRRLVESNKLSRAVADSSQAKLALTEASRVEDRGKDLLLRWCQAVGALFGLEIMDFSTSFADGKALATIVHYYHPSMLPLNEIRPTSRDMADNTISRRRLTLDQARYNEKLNSTLAHTRLSELGGIPNMMPTSDTTMVPDEKSMMVYLCYACSRLMNSRREVQACLKIQKRYRAHRQRRLKVLQEGAASIILKEWRMRKAAYYQNQRDVYSGPVATIEDFVLSRREALKLMKAARVERDQRHHATALMQVQIRRLIATRRVSVLRNQYKIAMFMQRCFRKMKARRTFEALFQATSASIQLQALWRGYISRKALLVTMSSIILVQSLIRKIIIQRRFHTVRKASVCIQKIWRAVWGQLQYQMDLMDIIAVQSVLRRRTAIRHRHVKLQAARALQLATRCFLARCKLSRRRRAAQARRRDHSSAVICQSLIRAFLATRKTSNRRLQFVAATLVQREWRAKQARWQLERQNHAATKIQTLHRTTTARRDYAVHLSSTRTIQVLWRNFAKRRTQERIVRLQSHVRSWLSRCYMASRKNGILVLQRAARCYLVKRRTREEVQLWHHSAVLIQSHARGHFWKRNYAMQRTAAIFLQSWWRSVKLLVSYRAMVTSIVQIEALVRGHQARERIREEKTLEDTIKNLLNFGKAVNQETATAAILLQKHWRAYKEVRAFHQKQYLVKMLAAHYRGKKARSQQRHFGQNAIKIQSLIRRHLAKAGRIEAVLTVVQLQGWWRAYNTASKYQSKRLNATKIQAWTRGQFSKRKVKEEVLFQATMSSLMKESLSQSQTTSAASLCIQSQWRSYRSRSQFAQAKEQIVALQTLARGFLARLCRQRQLRHIVTIQALTRQKMQSKQYENLKRGVKLLQATVRSKRLKNEYGDLKSKVTLVQALVRGWSTRQHQSNISRHIVVIQSCWRGFEDRTRYQRFICGLVLFQGLCRQSVARCEFAHKRKAALEIQRGSRCWLAKKQLSRLKHRRARAQEEGALALQSLYRSHIVRKQIRRLHENASIIQRKWHAFLTMLEFRMCLFDIVTVQSVARRWLGKRKISPRKAAIVRMQSIARMWLSSRFARKEFTRMLEIRRIQSSAVQIQKLFRGHLARARSTRERAAREIQKCWRCYTVHVEFLIVLLGTMEIQAHARGLLARRHYKTKTTSIVCIQAAFRGFVGRKLASTKKIAVVRLQANMKMLFTRAAFHHQLESIRNDAAVNIQKIWRGYTENLSYLLKVFSSLQIQQVARIYLAKTHRSRLEAERRRVLIPIAVATIQGVVRTFLAKGAFRRMVRQVTSFQALARGHRARRKRGKRMKITASRLKQANLRATETPNMQLGARTIAALTVLQTSTRLAEIMTAICTLELSTRYSRPCCEAFAHARATHILLSLIKQCNRSLPHVELLTYILLTLKNVAQYDSLLTYVGTKLAAEIFLDLIQMFRDKDGIFCFSVSLLERCIRYDDEIKEICRSHENLKRLKGVHTLCVKKLRSGSSRSSIAGSRARPGDSRRKSIVLGGLGSPDLVQSTGALRCIIALVEA